MPSNDEGRGGLSLGLGSEFRAKQLRYLISSVLSVLAGQGFLAFTFGVLKWSAVASNVASFILAGVVAYWLHRHWTWRRTGRSALWTELVPYWLIALVSLVLSTLAVRAIADASWRFTDQRIIVTAFIMAGALVVNGIFWVVKYIVFDRYLFFPPKRGEGLGPASPSPPGRP